MPPKNEARQKVLKRRRRAGAGVAVSPDDIHRGRGKDRLTDIGTTGPNGCPRNYSPAHTIANQIGDALDATKAPGKCRTLADMSDKEKAALEERLGAPIAKTDREALWTSEAVVLAETENAIRLRIDRGDDTQAVFWLPKKFLLKREELGDTVRVTMPTWAIKRFARWRQQQYTTIQDRVERGKKKYH
jgi:hypothetical protein